MGFSSAKRALLAALEAGNFQHEAREVLSEKNLLAVGDISVDEVISIVKRARTIRHRLITGVQAWGCTCSGPTVAETRWYVKAYSLEEPEGTAVFISIHR